MSAGVSPQARRGALEALDRIINRGGDADDVLREALVVLHGVCAYAAIAFVENNSLVVGPELGTRPERVESVDISFQGMKVAELHVAPGADPEERAFLERYGLLVSPYCLVGWDTGGKPWPEAG